MLPPGPAWDNRSARDAGVISEKSISSYIYREVLHLGHTGLTVDRCTGSYVPMRENAWNASVSHGQSQVLLRFADAKVLCQCCLREKWAVRFQLCKCLCLKWATRANAPLVYRFHSLTHSLTQSLTHSRTHSLTPRLFIPPCCSDGSLFFSQCLNGICACWYSKNRCKSALRRQHPTCWDYLASRQCVGTDARLCWAMAFVVAVVLSDVVVAL